MVLSGLVLTRHSTHIYPGKQPPGYQLCAVIQPSQEVEPRLQGKAGTLSVKAHVIAALTAPCSRVKLPSRNHL